MPKLYDCCASIAFHEVGMENDDMYYQIPRMHEFRVISRTTWEDVGFLAALPAVFVWQTPG